VTCQPVPNDIVTQKIDLYLMSFYESKKIMKVKNGQKRKALEVLQASLSM